MCVPGLSWKYLPALVGILMMSAMITTYIVAVSLDHVAIIFPYISDTGVNLPERSIFGEFFNLIAFLAVIMMVLRYKLIQELTGGENPAITRLSRVCLVLACLSCLGLTMVANFQETAMEGVHLLGACMVFLGGLLYALLDTSVSYKMSPQYNGRYICHIRLTLACLGLLSLCITIISAVISREQWATQDSPPHDRLHWKPSDPGFTAHLVSTFGEWAMAIAFLLYFFTHIRDFDKFSVNIRMVLHVTHLDMESLPSEEDTEPYIVADHRQRGEASTETSPLLI